MHSQGDLFRPMCATHHTTQGRLFDLDGPAESDLACQQCGEYLVRTQSGYLCCPEGCGRLIEATVPRGTPDQEPCGSWFDVDTEE